jgi:hypothetical protein
VLDDPFPRLLSFVRNTQISVEEVMEAPDLDSLFSLPLSAQAYQEKQALQVYLQEISYQPTRNDSWTYIWGNNKYSSHSFYKFVFSGIQTAPTFSWSWKSKCTLRIKFFAWLLFLGRLNTKDILQRRKS